ncbi:TIGR03545 family protein [Nautilia lithotrophica]
MGFVFKFFKELNSAENDKFIIFAVILGMICGFLPFFNIFTLIILIIAFIIRIPFGLFLASWGIFSIVGYFLDPVFSQTGYALLTTSVFMPLWEYLYNLPLMRWSGFNNTIVMGGLIWGVILSIVLFFILNKSIKIYRKKFFDFCLRYKFLKWIVPDFHKKNKIVRLSGILGLVTIFAVIGVIIGVFLDPVAKRVTEYSLAKIFNKPVKIETFDTSFKKAEIKIKNLQIGDTKTDQINIELSWYYLLWKKFDIQNLNVLNIHTDKSINEFIDLSNNKTSNFKKTSKIVRKINVSLPKPEQLIKGYKLESLEKIEKLKTDYEEFVVAANQVKKDLINSKQNLEQIKIQIKELERLSKNIKSPDNIQKIVAKTKEIKKSINSLKAKAEYEKNKLVTLKKQIMNDLEEIKKATNNDYKKLAEKYDMLKNGKYYAFAQTFIQPEIKKYIDIFIKYYTLLQPYLKSEDKKDKEYIRSEGVYITYKDKIKYPDFVIEKGKISLKSNDVDLKIKVTNISSDQELLNKEGFVNASAISRYFESAKLSVRYLKKAMFDFEAKNIQIKKMNVGELVLLNSKINIFSHGIIEKKYFDIITDLNIKPEKMVFKANKYIAKAVEKLKKLNVKIVVSGNIQKYNIKISSDIDKMFSQYLKHELNAQINNSKLRLKKILNEQMKNEISKTGFNTDKFIIINNIDSFESSIDSLKKNLQNYTEKQLSKKLLKKGIGDFIKF